MFKGSVWGAQTNNPGKAFVFCPLRNPTKSPQWLIPAEHSENFLGWSRMALFASMALACALATYARFGLTSSGPALTLASIALFCLGQPLSVAALTAVYGRRIAPEPPGPSPHPGGSVPLGL